MVVLVVIIESHLVGIDIPNRSDFASLSIEVIIIFPDSHLLIECDRFVHP